MRVSKGKFKESIMVSCTAKQKLRFRAYCKTLETENNIISMSSVLRNYIIECADKLDKKKMNQEKRKAKRILT